MVSASLAVFAARCARQFAWSDPCASRGVTEARPPHSRGRAMTPSAVASDAMSTPGAAAGTQRLSSWVLGLVALLLTVPATVMLAGQSAGLDRGSAVVARSVDAGFEARGLADAEVPVTTLVDDPGAPHPVVVVVHGFAGSAQLMDDLGVSLARAGYAVVLPDLTGHGRNPVPLPVSDGVVATDAIDADLGRRGAVGVAAAVRRPVATDRPRRATRWVQVRWCATPWTPRRRRRAQCPSARRWRCRCRRPTTYRSAPRSCRATSCCSTAATSRSGSSKRRSRGCRRRTPTASSDPATAHRSMEQRERPTRCRARTTSRSCSPPTRASRRSTGSTPRWARRRRAMTPTARASSGCCCSWRVRPSGSCRWPVCCSRRGCRGKAGRPRRRARGCPSSCWWPWRAR